MFDSGLEGLAVELLKKYKYPPEGMEDALETVMTQCELWTDNNDMDASGSEKREAKDVTYDIYRPLGQMVAEPTVPYGSEYPEAKLH